MERLFPGGDERLVAAHGFEERQGIKLRRGIEQDFENVEDQDLCVGSP